MCAIDILWNVFGNFYLKIPAISIAMDFLNLKMTLPNYKKDLQRPTRHIFS